MIGPVMVEPVDAQGIIYLESIGVRDTVRINAPLNNGRQRCGACVGIYGRANFAITLQQTGTCCFPCGSTSAFSFSDSSKVTLVGLNLSRQMVTGQMRGNQASRAH